jgi:hypothetical protein
LRIRSAASVFISNCSIDFYGLVWKNWYRFLTFVRASLKGFCFDMNQNKIMRMRQYEVPMFPKRYAVEDGK